MFSKRRLNKSSFKSSKKQSPIKSYSSLSKPKKSSKLESFYSERLNPDDCQFCTPVITNFNCLIKRKPSVLNAWKNELTFIHKIKASEYSKIKKVHYNLEFSKNSYTYKPKLLCSPNKSNKKVNQVISEKYANTDRKNYIAVASDLRKNSANIVEKNKSVIIPMDDAEIEGWSDN